MRLIMKQQALLLGVLCSTANYPQTANDPKSGSQMILDRK